MELECVDDGGFRETPSSDTGAISSSESTDPEGDDSEPCLSVDGPGPVSPDALSDVSTIERETGPPIDTPSLVSLLGGRYLLFAGTKNFLKCINVETRQQYTCKVMDREKALSVLSMDQKMEEGSDLILRVNEVVSTPTNVYLIMPSHYGNLHSHLLTLKKLKESDAAPLFRQIVSVVDFCHTRGIVLRDLKMGKFVFIDPERSRLRLESLEDAVLVGGEGDGLRDKHGCPNYVSPEKAEILRSNHRSYPGKATDVWGLGVILYTLLVGRYPFHDLDHGKLLFKIRRCEYVVPEVLSTSSKCLIKCLLRKTPMERLHPKEILKHPWFSEFSSSPKGIMRSSGDQVVPSI